MELTVEQALQQGIEAHKAGKLEDAQRIYYSILTSQPRHPHACHNLGVLKASSNKTDAALPFFKIAIESNPTIEQFWLSYIEALIKVSQYSDASLAIAQAEKHGIEGERLRSLALQLSSNIQKQNAATEIPSQELLKSLLLHYRKGELNKAEQLSERITQDFPMHQFAWKILGSTYRRTGKKSKALYAYRKAVELSPEDAAAHSNVGVTLKGMGRLEEAEFSHRKAIGLKPDFVEAHCNLGISLQGQNKLLEAEASYMQAISLKPDLAEAHNYLGGTLQKQGRIDEARAAYETAIALKPDYFSAHSNLGGILQNLGEFEEAIRHYDLGGASAICKSLECLYINRSYSEFNERVKSIAALDTTNISVAAVSAFVSQQLGEKDNYPFCRNPLDFICVKNALEYDDNAHSLMSDIIEEAGGYKLGWERRTTKNGYQGHSDIFDDPSKNNTRLERIIIKSLDDYYNEFKRESNALIELWPHKKRLNGWYNRLIKNGYHTSHIHPGGWLSGVIYLKTIEADDQDEGAIEFSLHGYGLPIINKNLPRKVISPKRGDIILFPSSLFHRTIPFTQDAERCVVAFDVKRQ